MVAPVFPNLIGKINKAAVAETWRSWSWRREHQLASARWRLRARTPVARGAHATHAALSHAGDRLAVAADDASVTVWSRSSEESGAGCCWRARWRHSESARGWAAACAVHWAPDDARLLLAGPLTLADRWELVVLRFDARGWAAAARVAGSACGGCWAGARAFVSLTTRLLAPGRAVTTLWLNAADQRLHSEHAGVTAPALRVYNEAAAGITHLLVVEVPAEELEVLEAEIAASAGPAGGGPEDADGPLPQYWRATLPVGAHDRPARGVAAFFGEKSLARPYRMPGCDALMLWCRCRRRDASAC
ncbi:F-box/WD repeat-containing protein 5-like [Battus philenor]|uniref:F-box/WD repeat-containing protein 5-like n=1 Tax=Battus philenor TaxID=42288 RepID=UPI0035CF1D70